MQTLFNVILSTDSKDRFPRKALHAGDLDHAAGIIAARIGSIAAPPNAARAWLGFSAPLNLQSHLP
jgi:hypothetical protein